MNQNISLSILFPVGLLCIAAAQGVLAGDFKANKIVYDKRGNPIRSILSGNCVRTAWDSGYQKNPCSVKEEPVMRIKPKSRYFSPVMRLGHEDKRVYFEFDSAVLSDQAKHKLDRLVHKLKRSDDIRDVDIIGFADTIGDPKYNLALSKRRAQAVQDYMTGKGYIDTHIADTQGVGETHSVTGCDDIKTVNKRVHCLKPDRRVEVKITFLGRVTQ